MSSDIKIPKISQKHLLGIKYLSVEDVNNYSSVYPNPSENFIYINS